MPWNCLSTGFSLIFIQLTNDFIDATSHGLHHPSHRITADRMAAVSSGHDPAAASKPTEIHSPQQFTDIYTTPETGIYTLHTLVAKV